MVLSCTSVHNVLENHRNVCTFATWEFITIESRGYPAEPEAEVTLWSLVCYHLISEASPHRKATLPEIVFGWRGFRNV